MFAPAAALIALALAASGPAAAATQEERRPPGICAHRGDVAAAPENTLPAFESAVRKGVHMIEFDVRRTRDGELIILHDARVDRTTDGSGLVSEMTFAEVRALDAGSWFDPAFADTRIPTLRETLEAIPREILCNVHLRPEAGLAAQVAELIRDMDRLDQCFLACTRDQVIEAREAVPGIKTCNMTRPLGDTPAYVEQTIELGAEYLQFFRVPPETVAEVMPRVHEGGVIANYCCTETPEVLRALAEAGVDYILTDDVDAAFEALAPFGTRPLEIAAARARTAPARTHAAAARPENAAHDKHVPWIFRNGLPLDFECPCPLHGGANPAALAEELLNSSAPPL